MGYASQKTLDQIATLIKEMPGISSREIKDFFDSVAGDNIASFISILYSKGDFRREQMPSSRAYRYWYEPGAKPVMERRKIVPTQGPTNPASSAAIQEMLRKQITELEEWKAMALERYPDLAVPSIIVRARKIAASEFGEPSARASILKGEKDDSPIIKAIVKALETVS